MIDKPIMRIPTLAIHLDRAVNTEGFKFNFETQLSPVLATEVKTGSASPMMETDESLVAMHASLLRAIKGSLPNSARADQILSVDLCLYDTQKATLGGVNEEFINSARLDNLFMSFTGLAALLESCTTPSTPIGALDDDEHVRMLVLFDNEEVGSLSSAGAESTLVASAIRKIIKGLDVAEHEFESILARSFLLSADMAHAVHPNYSYSSVSCIFRH
jgi:aspartyl aminopeptidase